MRGRGDTVAERLAAVAGCRVIRMSARGVIVRCPLGSHDDRSPSAAILATGVLTCSACGGRLSPYALLVDFGGCTPAEATALLVELGLRTDGYERRGQLGPTSTRRAAAASPSLRSAARPPAPAMARELPALAPSIDERLVAASRARGARVDARLFVLRAWSPAVLDAAGVGVGVAAEFGRFGAAVAAAAAERRVTIPVRDARRRLVGALFFAPNPTRRHEPKVLALPGSARLPLVLTPSAGVNMRAPLLVVEGEADALTAASCGFAVVGVPGVGSAVTHAAAIARTALGHSHRQVILVPDADERGRAGFAALAAALDQELPTGGARVRCADVLPDGDDVGSFLAAAARYATGSDAERFAAARGELDLLLEMRDESRLDEAEGVT